MLISSLVRAHILATLRRFVELFADGSPPCEMKGVLEMLTTYVESATAGLLPPLHERLEAAVVSRVHMWAASFVSAPAPVCEELLLANRFGPHLVAASDVAKVYKE